MKRVTGIGGTVFEAQNAPALWAWGGPAFGRADADGATTMWSFGSHPPASRECRRFDAALCLGVLGG